MFPNLAQHSTISPAVSTLAVLASTCHHSPQLRSFMRNTFCKPSQGAGCEMMGHKVDLILFSLRPSYCG